MNEQLAAGTFGDVSNEQPDHERRKILENNARLMALQDLYIGNTLYILGSGPSLNGIEPEWIAEIEKFPAIGLNRTTYLAKTRYFVSAYISDCLMARMRHPDMTCVHIRPSLSAPLVPGLLTAKRIATENPEVIRHKFSSEEPTLFTRNNAMFAATHLALVMGAKRIVYIGVEQRNALHFYNGDETIRQRLFDDMMAVIKGHGDILGRDHPYERPYEMLRSIFESPRDLIERQYYVTNHTELLYRWRIFARDAMGVSMVSAVRESVICDAGAEYQPLSHLIEEEWRRDARRAAGGNLSRGLGYIDSLETSPRRVHLTGWAVDLIERRPAAEVLLMQGDKLVLRVKLGLQRPDVASTLANHDFAASGFDAVAEGDFTATRDNALGFRAYGKCNQGSLFPLSNSRDPH